MDAHCLSDCELLSELGKLLGSRRRLTARFVAYLGEIEERRLHLKAGFPSMFEFCMKELGLSEGEAFRRILAARLGKRFPIVYSLLASGAVNLTALELVREHLTEENHAELLEAVSRSSKREIQALLATRFPMPGVPSRIRKLPSRLVLAGAADPPTGSAFELRPAASPKISERHRTRVEQLSEARFKVEFTASAALREKLELCRDLMSHANPTRDLGVVVERAVDLLIAALEKKRLARAKRPRTEPAVAREAEGLAGARQARSGRVTCETRRKVFERDGLQCSFVSAEGRRCESRAFLELDHAVPRAQGGGDDAENLRVRCRAHNQLWAEEAFGREHVEHFRQQRQQKCQREGFEERPGRPRVAPASWSETLEKVRLALRGLGFRDAEARRAVREVEKEHAGTEPLTTEQALREALAATVTTAA